MKVLVCGGRSYEDYKHVKDTLDSIHRETPISMLIQGGAQGADHHAKVWANHAGVHSAQVDALWWVFGKSAGVLRNGAMLVLQPDLVVAFPGNRGTADMVERAKNEGIKVSEIPPRFGPKDLP